MPNRPQQPTLNTLNSTADGAGAQAAGYSGMLLAAALLMLVGWVGLAQLVATARPRIGGEIWLFFILLQMAVTGTAIPLVLYLSRLSGFSAAAGVVVRRSVWVGIMTVTCAWLLIPRALSLPFVFVLLLMFVVIEIFLRSRESARELADES